MASCCRSGNVLCAWLPVESALKQARRSGFGGRSQSSLPEPLCTDYEKTFRISTFSTWHSLYSCKPIVHHVIGTRIKFQSNPRCADFRKRRSQNIEQYGEINMDSEKRDEKFERARVELKKEYKDKTAAAKAMYPFFSPSTVGRLWDDKYKKKIDDITKDRLIKYSLLGTFTNVHGAISNLIEQRDEDEDWVKSNALGKYSYFRYFAPTGNPAELLYVRGSIEIKLHESQVPVFEHRSHNHTESAAEHIGFVFLCSGHLYLLGKRKNVIRLAIAKMFEEPSQPMTGLVLSMRRKQRDPFSARFVMVRDENEEQIKKLSDKGKNPNFVHGSTSEDGAGMTKGENEFFRITNGAYSYLMLNL
jgi:hypothetical protein